MDPGDFFRKLFGFGNRGFGEPGGYGNHSFPEGDFEDDGSDINDMFHHFHSEMHKQMEQLNQQMEEVFKTFGATDFPAGVPEQPGLPTPRSSPRDSMLKPSQDVEVPKSNPHPALPEEHRPSLFGRLFSIPRFGTLQPHEKIDSDLDSEVEGKGLSEIFAKPPRTEEHEGGVIVPHSPRLFSSNSSISITTVRGADGKVEHRKTVRNSDGNEETTVTRQVGDKVHSVTTKKDQFGVVQESESFQNMDRDDLKLFDNSWKDQGRQPVTPLDEMIEPRKNTSRYSVLKNIFGIDISQWWK